MTHILEQFRFVNALAPVADAFSGTVYPTGFNMKAAGRIAWLVVKGVGATGTSTITVLAGSDTSPISETAVEFYYQQPGSGSMKADYLIGEDVVTPGGIRSMENCVGPPGSPRRRYQSFCPRSPRTKSRTCRSFRCGSISMACASRTARPRR